MSLFFGSREESEQRKKDRDLENDIINILYLYKGESEYLIEDMIMREVKKHYKENNNGKN